MGFHLLGADFPHDIAEDINPHDFSILDTLDEASLMHSAEWIGYRHCTMEGLGVSASHFH